MKNKYQIYKIYWTILVTNKGASPQQDYLASQQASFYSTMTANYNEQFAKQGAILETLKATWEPILSKGPGQYGFSEAQDTVLRTQATEGTARSFENAKRSLGENLGAISGGNIPLPFGEEGQLLAELTSESAKSESDKQLGITQAGYERGYQNFLAASNALSGNASIYNPVGYAGAANQAGSDAFSSATKIAEMNSQSGVWGAVGGILGGAASAFTGGLGQAAGGAAGKKWFG